MSPADCIARAARRLLVAAAVFASCGSHPAERTITPRLVATHTLAVSEPSDLAIDPAGKVMWTVSNKPARVYQLDLDGNVLKTLKFEGADLEGIAYDATDRTLWVVEERIRELVHLSLDGEELGRFRLDLPGKKNSGPEGICLDERGRMFVVNEKEPGLFLELNAKRAIAKRKTLDFALDFSAIAYDPATGGFWILSDQSQKLFLWSRDRGVSAELALPFTKAEGVAVDRATGLIYIVSETDNTLYVYRM